MITPAPGGGDARRLGDTAQRLMRAGCHYRLEALAPPYADDLPGLLLQADGRLQGFGRAANLACFRARQQAGAPPPGTTATFHSARGPHGTGHVIARRLMGLGAGPQRIVFSLMLHHSAQGQWQVFRRQASAPRRPRRAANGGCPVAPCSSPRCSKPALAACCKALPTACPAVCRGLPPWPIRPWRPPAARPGTRLGATPARPAMPWRAWSLPSPGRRCTRPAPAKPPATAAPHAPCKRAAAPGPVRGRRQRPARPEGARPGLQGFSSKALPPVFPFHTPT